MGNYYVSESRLSLQLESSANFGTRLWNSLHPERRVGLMVRVLDSGSSGPASGPGWGHCVVFLGKTLLSRCLSPPRCINGYRRNARGNPAMD